MNANVAQHLLEVYYVIVIQSLFLLPVPVQKKSVNRGLNTNYIAI